MERLLQINKDRPGAGTDRKLCRKSHLIPKRYFICDPDCPINILRYIGAHIIIYFKNGSRIKILIFPRFLMKMLDYSILDHIYMSSGTSLGFAQNGDHFAQNGDHSAQSEIFLRRTEIVLCRTEIVLCKTRIV